MLQVLFIAPASWTAAQASSAVQLSADACGVSVSDVVACVNVRNTHMDTRRRQWLPLLRAQVCASERSCVAWLESRIAQPCPPPPSHTHTRTSSAAQRTHTWHKRERECECVPFVQRRGVGAGRVGTAHRLALPWNIPAPALFLNMPSVLPQCKCALAL